MGTMKHKVAKEHWAMAGVVWNILFSVSLCWQEQMLLHVSLKASMGINPVSTATTTINTGFLILLPLIHLSACLHNAKHRLWVQRGGEGWCGRLLWSTIMSKDKAWKHTQSRQKECYKMFHYRIRLNTFSMQPTSSSSSSSSLYVDFAYNSICGWLHLEICLLDLNWFILQKVDVHTVYTRFQVLELDWRWWSWWWRWWGL